MAEEPADDDAEGIAARTIYLPAKDPKWEAIEIGEVDRRIRSTLTDVPEDAIETLAIAVMMSVATPPDLGNCLTNAVSALEGVRVVFAETAANEGSLLILRELRDDVFTFIGTLQALRDRTYRYCDHSRVEELTNGSSMCSDCKSIWGPGQLTKDRRPGRMLTPRAYSALVEGQKPPGKAAFFYLATEICRRHKLKKLDAMKAAVKLLDLFWPDGAGYESEPQMESAHREGRESAERNQFITAEDLETHSFWDSARIQIIWVPYPTPEEPAD